MKNNAAFTRRNFLKSSAVASAGIAMLGPAAKKAAAADFPTKVINISTTPINKDIDNLRVAYITDPAMVRSAAWNVTEDPWANFNNPANTSGVAYDVVKTNMDKLACSLANKPYPAGIPDAWSTIFKLPAGKTWATAKAAIKVNGFAFNQPSVPIVKRVCDVLVSFGMPAANITLLDAGPYESFIGGDAYQIPSSIARTNSFATHLTFTDGKKFYAADAIATADIVLNIAVNKGHDQYVAFGGVTMCQKNHYWTFCNWGHTVFEDMARVNSCDYLLGDIPTTYPAKQQLCIVDSLWIGNNGSWAGAITDGNNANTIAMSTFAGALDYVSTMKIRATKGFMATTNNDNGFSGWNQTIVNKFLTGYGYDLATASAILMAAKTKGAGPGVVDANNFTPDTVAVSHESAAQVQGSAVHFEIAGNGVIPVHMSIYLSRGETVRSATILDVQGRKIRTLNVEPSSLQISWDGRTDASAIAHSGCYIVKIRGERSMVSGEIILNR